jgi:hypothetical protein
MSHSSYLFSVGGNLVRCASFYNRNAYRSCMHLNLLESRKQEVTRDFTENFLSNNITFLLFFRLGPHKRTKCVCRNIHCDSRCRNIKKPMGPKLRGSRALVDGRHNVYWFFMDARRALLTDITALYVLEWSKPDRHTVNIRHLWDLAFPLLNYYNFFYHVIFAVVFYHGYWNVAKYGTASAIVIN